MARHRTPPEPVGVVLGRGARSVADDSLYRGSLLLLVNTCVLTTLGFIFWTVAARTYPAAEVGVFAAVTSGVNLLCAVAAVGVPNMLMRDLGASGKQAKLFLAAVVTVASIGGSMTVVALWSLDQLTGLGYGTDASAHGRLLALVLVLITAVGGIVDVGLVVQRAHFAIVAKSVAGGLAKVVALPVLAALGSGGLLLAAAAGATVSTVIGFVILTRGFRPAATRTDWRRLRTSLLRRGRFSAVNYVGTLFGMIPATVVPMTVFAVRGSVEAAWLSVAALLAGFLNFIPSTTAQVLVAEISRGDAIRAQFLKAVRGVYALLLPAALLLLTIAPYLLAVFGPGYAANATTCLRWLVVASLVSAVNYLVDATIIASGRAAHYVFVNAANAVLVLTGVAAALPFGLTGLGIGWTIAQFVSLALGLVVLRAIGVRPGPADAGGTNEGRGPRRHVVAGEGFWLSRERVIRRHRVQRRTQHRGDPAGDSRPATRDLVRGDRRRRWLG
jgi:O-antigen/teichoic acid export membrane protein